MNIVYSPAAPLSLYAPASDVIVSSRWHVSVCGFMWLEALLVEDGAVFSC